ncbi:GntR family transcriptional regulator [Xanthobacter sp. YC-JY1]|uniref:GntR family transcriptional regulator n=1 Tax=Xanthobacter sp. YC-JY1 TaxID=2419844 RepID=UPI001F3019EC|nr:GntR family transcriptional regulator [Xanthobacter sp. YC-JY1]
MSKPNIAAGAEPRRAQERSPAGAAHRGEGEGLESKPLYRQVRETLIRRMVDGVWAPGEPLPSEIQLAAELGVSQGTVRKALDEMAAENIVVRRQGRGTFVARHDEERILFQFFKLVGDDGERHFPESRVLGIERAKGSAAECAALALPRNGRVLRIRRLRTFDGAPLIIESLILPDQMFPGLADAPVPNNLYGLYAQRYGITVARAREQLKAVGADADTAAMLHVEPGAPVLLIDRLAYSLDGTPVEWRVSFCLTAGFHYLSDLT